MQSSSRSITLVTRAPAILGVLSVSVCALSNGTLNIITVILSLPATCCYLLRTLEQPWLSWLTESIISMLLLFRTRSSL